MNLIGVVKRTRGLRISGYKDSQRISMPKAILQNPGVKNNRLALPIQQQWSTIQQVEWPTTSKVKRYGLFYNHQLFDCKARFGIQTNEVHTSDRSCKTNGLPGFVESGCIKYLTQAIQDGYAP